MSASDDRVGPVLKTGEVATAALEALRTDNPGKEFAVHDHVAYVRIETDGECVILRETMERELGRPFQMAELETVLASFAGQIEASTDHFRFYLERKA